MKKDRHHTSYIIHQGFSLVEILIVISIFAVIGILSTRALFLTLKGAKKSDSMVRVRENVNFSMAVIERQIRNSQSVVCPNASPLNLDYIALEGVASSFSCQSIGTNGYIASGSARLTSQDVNVTDCSLVCTQTNINKPPSVKVSLTATDLNTQTAEKATVTAETEIVVRNY